MICKKCSEPITNLNRPKSGTVCKVCIKKWHAEHYQRPEIKQRHLEQGRKWRTLNKEKSHIQDLKSRLKKEYGITVGEYEAILKSQHNKCAICKSDSPKRKSSRGFFVDHNHNTGLIRGLLCHRCNLAVGWVEDSPDLILSLANYIACGIVDLGDLK